MNQNEALQLAKDALDKALQEKKMSQEMVRSLGPAILEAIRPSIEQMASNALITRQELLKAIAGIIINVPQTNVPEAKVTVQIPKFEIPTPIVNVTVPEIKIPPLSELKIPIIKVPKPEVTVNFDASQIKIPKIVMPDQMDVKGWIGLMGYDKGLLANPLPVQLRDAKGNPVSLGGITSLGGGSSFPMAAFDQATQAIKVTGSFSISASNSSTQAIDSSGNPYSAANPFPVSATFSGATVITLINNDGLAYNSDNPLPVTGTFSSTPGLQVSGATDSVNVAMYGGNVVPSGLNETTAGVMRVVQMTDSVSSVSVTNSPSVLIQDSQASTITSHQLGDFRGLDITNLRSVNVESTLNSSASTLTSGSIFTGLAEDVKDFSVIQVSVISDVASATDGLSVQQSSDGSNWDITDVYTIPAATGKTFSFQVAARYFRIVYTNGGTNQASFRLYAVLHQTVSKNSSQRPGDGLSNENDFEQVSAYLAALNASGTWDRLHTSGGDSAGALRVVQAVDSISSVAVTGFSSTVGANIVDSSGVAYTTANPMVILVSDISASVKTALTDSSGVQYSGSNPLPVTLSGESITLDQTTDSIAIRQVSGAVESVFIVGPIAQGDSATAVRIIQAGDSSSSVAASQVGTWNVQVQDSLASTITSHQFNTDFRGLDVYVGGFATSVAANLSDSGGIGYSGSNPLPVTWVSGAGATVGAANIDSSGVQYSGSNPFPMTLSVTNATTTVNVAITDSGGVQYSGSNPIPVAITSGANNTTATNVVDSSGVAYSGSNPIPVTLVTSLTQNVNLVGGGNDSMFVRVAHTANPTAVADGADVRPMADKLGRTVMRNIHVRDLIITAFATFATGTEATLLAGTVAKYNDLIYVLAANNSTAGIGIDIRPSTAGSIVMHLEIPAGGTVGVAAPVPIPQQATGDGTGGTWTVDLPDVTGTTVSVSGLFSQEI